MGAGERLRSGALAGSILRGSKRLRREIVMRSGAILVLLLTVPYANADVIFDFSGICQSGDCDPGSVVTAEMHFTDDASLTHRDSSGHGR